MYRYAIVRAWEFLNPIHWGCTSSGGKCLDTGHCTPSSLQTFPEIIPYINVCINLMEQIYSVKVAAGEGGASGDALVPGTESTAQEASGVDLHV